ncbi:MAG: hypothetical protein ACXVZ3_03590 [Gaiellaceae bacterium]
MSTVWTRDLEAAWEPLARETGTPTRLWVENLLGNLMKRGRALDDLIDQLRDGTMLDVLTKAIERR